LRHCHTAAVLSRRHGDPQRYAAAAAGPRRQPNRERTTGTHRETRRVRVTEKMLYVCVCASACVSEWCVSMCVLVCGCTCMVTGRLWLRPAVWNVRVNGNKPWEMMMALVVAIFSAHAVARTWQNSNTPLFVLQLCLSPLSLSLSLSRTLSLSLSHTRYILHTLLDRWGPSLCLWRCPARLDARAPRGHGGRRQPWIC
jgi:hypothetical protein